MYEPITVVIDRDYDGGTYHSHSITFTGRLVRIVKEGSTTMRLYEWVDRGYLVYLVHAEEHKPAQLPRRTLYPFINNYSTKATPTKGYTAEEVARTYPEFSNGELWGRSRGIPAW